MAKYPGLVLRKNVWYVRKRIPKDLRCMYSAAETRLSLKTTDLNEAKTLYHGFMLKLENQFTQKRIERDKPSNKDQLSEYSHSGLLALALDWYCEMQSKCAEIDQKDTRIYTQEQVYNAYTDNGLELTELQDALKTNNFEKTYMPVQKWLKKRNLSFNVQSQNFHALCKHILKSQIYAIEIDMKEYNSVFTEDTIPPFLKHVEHPSPQPLQQQTSPKMPLSELLSLFLKRPERKDVSIKTNQLYITAIERLIDFAGEHLCVHEVNRPLLEKYRDALREYPAKGHTLKKLKNKPFNEKIKAAKELGINPMSVSTINKHIHNLKALFDYAEHSGYITKNPVIKLNLKDHVSDKNKRDPWPVKTLNDLFRTSLFQPTNPKQFKKSKYDETLYWACLIALWTGLRQSEICQLQSVDLKMDGDTPYLDIVARPEHHANLKTECSIRKVPIHKELIACGLVKLFRKRVHNKETWLFPALTTSSSNGRGHYIGKRFKKLIVDHNLAEDKCSFHSFRHNFRDALRDAEINIDIVSALGGWSTGEKQLVSTSYGSGYKVKKLNDNLQKIRYEGLDLSHLHTEAPSE